MEDKALKIINHFGAKHQLKKLGEETYEFQEAVLSCDNREHIVEEMSDIRVVLEEFKAYYNITEKEIKAVEEFKINRTLKELEEIEKFIKEQKRDV